MTSSPQNPFAPPKENGPLPLAELNRLRVKQLLWWPARLMLGLGVMTLLLIAIIGAMCGFMSLFLPDFGAPFGRFLSQNPWISAGILATILGSLFCIYGGVQMLHLRRYGHCLTAALVMTIPGTSPGFWFGWIFGIWALVILLRKDTRAAFSNESPLSPERK